VVEVRIPDAEDLRHHEGPAVHPIRVAARRCGLSPALIRAWERRYGAVQPGRDADNERIYTEADIRRLTLLRRAVEGGRRIGAIATFTSDALAELVDEDRSAGPPADPLQKNTAEILDHVRSLNLAGALSALEDMVDRDGWQDGLQRGVFPLIRKLEADHRDGRSGPAEVSVLATAVRALLTPLVARSAAPGNGGPAALVLAADSGSVAGLMVAACAACHGFRTTVVADTGDDQETAAVASTIDAAVVLTVDHGDGGGFLPDQRDCPRSPRPVVAVSSGLSGDNRGRLTIEDLAEMLDGLRAAALEAEQPHAHPHRSEDPFMAMDVSVPLCLHVSGDIRPDDRTTVRWRGRGAVHLDEKEHVAEVAAELDQCVRRAAGGDGFGSGAVLAAAHLHDFGHRVLIRACRVVRRDVVREAASSVVAALGPGPVDASLRHFAARFDLSTGESDPIRPLSSATRAMLLEEMLIIRVLATNPALKAMSPLFSLAGVCRDDSISEMLDRFQVHLKHSTSLGAGGRTALQLLAQPAEEGGHDLVAQMQTILRLEGELAGHLAAQILRAVDVLREETRSPFVPGPPAAEPPKPVIPIQGPDRFTPDREWMPGLVLAAKHTLVWLRQLEHRFGRSVRRLDQIPDEALGELADCGVTGLWLVGVWERSPASATIKALCGRDRPTASAYSIRSYDVAEDLGGEDAMRRLSERASRFGIRLGGDVVANHTGIDSPWVVDHPDRFVSTAECPYPAYTFGGRNLVDSDRVRVVLADQYLDESDAPVVFLREDVDTGEIRYLYHGNDGTGLPWNDTAQLDYTRRETREAMIEVIVEIARRFPILRLDAAMALARRHVQRLWYPRPGDGGAIPSRSLFGLSEAEFNRSMPTEFWRDVVVRIRREAPDTMLVAEAFWMMEGIFAREVGLNRVYNSAFMHHLRDEENDRFRELVGAVLEADPRFLEHGLNYLSTPDEATAVSQFGRAEKYRAAMVLLATFPGTPLIAHGQLEGHEEQYGMEYDRPLRDEVRDDDVHAFHRTMAPLFAQRSRFAGAATLRLVRAVEEGGGPARDVIAYQTGAVEAPPVLVVVNNGSKPVRCRLDAGRDGFSRSAEAGARMSGPSVRPLLEVNGRGGLRFDVDSAIAQLEPYQGVVAELLPTTGA
jgi:glycosidase/DNA-binding transcriptional MerR regulator